MAKNVALRSLMVETNCQDVVKLVNNKEGSKTEIIWVILEIQYRSKDFQHISFHYTPRSINAHPYSLAKLTLKSNGYVVWIEPLPADIKSIFSNLL